MAARVGPTSPRSCAASAPPGWAPRRASTTPQRSRRASRAHPSEGPGRRCAYAVRLPLRTLPRRASGRPPWSAPGPAHPASAHARQLPPCARPAQRSLSSSAFPNPVKHGSQATAPYAPHGPRHPPRRWRRRSKRLLSDPALQLRRLNPEPMAEPRRPQLAPCNRPIDGATGKPTGTCNLLRRQQPLDVVVGVHFLCIGCPAKTRIASPAGVHASGQPHGEAVPKSAAGRPADGSRPGTESEGS